MQNQQQPRVAQELQYDDQLENLLKEQAEIAESLSILHRNAHRKYNRLTNLINIPVIIGSSVVGFTTGLDLSYIENINIILGIISVFIGVIKSLDSYFQLGRTSERHRMVSLAYSQINKKIAIELALSRSDRISPKDMLAIVKSDIKNLEDISPLLPKDIVDNFSKEFCAKYPNVKKPNITNGLSPVLINKSETSDFRRQVSLTGNQIVSNSSQQNVQEGSEVSDFRRRVSLTGNQIFPNASQQNVQEGLEVSDFRRRVPLTGNQIVSNTTQQNVQDGMEVSEENIAGMQL